MNDSYYFDTLPYSSYNNNTYSFRQQSTSSNVYFSSHQHPFSSSSTNSDVSSYSNYDSTYLNVAVAYHQNGYPNSYHNNTIPESFDMNLFYGNNNSEQSIETDRKIPINKKRKFQDEPISNFFSIFLRLFLLQ